MDRMHDEFVADNADICASSPEEADVIWLLADFCWDQIPHELLKQKKVVTNLHHVVPSKFDLDDFVKRDAITDAYIVPNQHTRDLIDVWSTSPIHEIPYWCNPRIWQKSPLTKQQLRIKHGLPVDCKIWGSFQRDTEGAGIPQGIFLPKLEKGADLIADLFCEWQSSRPGLCEPHVLLAGWRREYIIQRLKNSCVPFSYIEMPSQADLCELYQCLDMYVIGSRYEGGPQALLECGLLDVPVYLLRDVGMSRRTLRRYRGTNCNGVPFVEDLKAPGGYDAYRRLFEGMMTT